MHLLDLSGSRTGKHPRLDQACSLGAGMHPNTWHRDGKVAGLCHARPLGSRHARQHPKVDAALHAVLRQHALVR